MWTYSIRLAKDDNGTYLATCPVLPELTTFGASIGDALAHARDAVEEAIAARMADRQPIPQPSTGPHVVELPTQTVAKMMLYQLMRNRRVSKVQLARSLRWHRPQVDRLLNIRHATRMDTLEAAFRALGARVSIKIELDARKTRNGTARHSQARQSLAHARGPKRQQAKVRGNPS